MIELYCFKNSGWASGNNRVSRNILRNHRSCSYQCILTNGDSSQYSCVASNRCTLFHMRFYHFPVGFRLLASIYIGSSGKKIVRKHNAVTYKYIVFNMHSLA